jgi:hypothetical protein
MVLHSYQPASEPTQPLNLIPLCRNSGRGRIVDAGRDAIRAIAYEVSIGSERIGISPTTSGPGKEIFNRIRRSREFTELSTRMQCPRKSRDETRRSEEKYVGASAASCSSLSVAKERLLLRARRAPLTRMVFREPNEQSCRRDCREHSTPNTSQTPNSYSR